MGAYQPGRRALLPGVHREGLEPPVVVHAAAQVERGVDHRRGVHPALCEHLRQGGHLFGQRLPAHERHRPAAGRVIGASRHRREPRGVVAVEAHGPGRERVERGRPDLSVPVCAQMVLPERVRDHPYDVQLLAILRHAHQTLQSFFYVASTSEFGCQYGRRPPLTL